MKKNSNDFSQATPFLSSACIWNIIGPLPTLSLSLYPPSCCFSLCFFPSLWSGFYSWPIFLHSSALDILALTLSVLFFFPFILLFSSLPPSLSISPTHSFSVFHSLSHTHTTLAVLRPFSSVCAVSNGSPQTSWLERRNKSEKLHEALRGWRRNSPSHTQEKKKESKYE